MRGFEIRRAELVAFVIALVAMLVGLFPLALALPLAGVTEAGLSARRAAGSIWGGRLEDASIGGVRLGNTDVRLQLLPLFVGRARLDLLSGFGSGGVSVTAGGRGMDDVTAAVPPGALAGPLPVDRLAFEDFSVRFESGRCAHAEGRVRLTFARAIGSVTLPGGLSGVARCDGRDLVLPLVSSSGAETLTLRVDGEGRYRGRLLLRTGDISTLTGLGFQPVPGGVALALDGRL